MIKAIELGLMQWVLHDPSLEMGPPCRWKQGMVLDRQNGDREWTVKTGTGKDKSGTRSGVGGYRVVDGIQLEKI